MIFTKVYHYARLMRLDKPIGNFLLLWPTLWALWLASNGYPKPYLFICLVLGVIIMRAAGCIINDILDRHVDGYVTRTKYRPLPQGDVSVKEAWLLFCFLILTAAILAYMLGYFVVLLSIVALGVTMLYPLMKRVTDLPQLVLSVAFSWGIPIAFAATGKSLEGSCWLMVVACAFWIVAYDTQYAMVDKEDDLKIGIRSTAIRFGIYIHMIVALLQLCALMILVALGMIHMLGFYYYLSLSVAMGFFVYQQWLMRQHDPKLYFQAFLNNQWVGLIIFMGFLASDYSVV